METGSIIIALGGNALSRRDEAGTIYQQFAQTRNSLEAIMHFIRQNYNICLIHGNGPQVGDELHRMELTHTQIPPLPLGVCVAGTQGTIGYMIQQSLQNALHDAGIEREVVTLITQVVVDQDDPSIKNPTKFIGQRYSRDKAEKLAKKFGWKIGEQNPGEWRQVVPSPLPQFVMHGKSIKTLVDNGIIVLAAGGGGIPAFVDDQGHLEGLDAVIDKDLAAALLGRVIKARELWIITDVDYVYRDYATPRQQPIKEITTTELEQLDRKGQFQEGSMRPKILAALYFLKYHGEKVVITSIPQVQQALAGKSGTIIRK